MTAKPRKPKTRSAKTRVAKTRPGKARPAKGGAGRRRAEGSRQPPGAAREALLRSAIRLLSEKGAGHVSLHDIARDARVNPALVKYHFGGKDELFKAVVEHVIQEWRRAIREAVPEGAAPLEALRARARATMTVQHRYPHVTRLVTDRILQEAAADTDDFVRGFARTNFEELRRLLRQGERAGDFRKVDPMFFFFAYVGICEFFFIARPTLRAVFGIDGIDEKLFDAFAEHTIDLMLHGVATAGKSEAKPRRRRRA